MARTGIALPSVLRRWCPGLALMLDYPRGALRGDVSAAFAVTVVMIPSVLAYAELAGVSPRAGLYAALASMVAFAVFTSARRVIIGPDTTIALLAGSVIAPLALHDPERAAQLAAALALMTGVLLAVGSRLGFGSIADLLSYPVLVGYAAGAALILVATQLPSLLGVPLPRDEFFLRVFDAVRALPAANGPTLALGAGLVVLILVLGRLALNVPGALVACVVALVLSWLLDLAASGVAHLAPIAAELPRPALPAVTLRDLQHLAPGAIALGLLIFAEGILLARTLAAKRRENVDADAELAALGAGNMAAGLVAGMPVGASTSRSVTSDASGMGTQLAQLLAAGLLALFVVFLAPMLDRLPRVALSAILIAAAVRLIDLRDWKTLLRLDRRAFVVALAVTLGVLVFGVLPGVLLGVALSLARLLASVARPRDAVLRRLPVDRRFHDLDDDEPGLVTPGVMVYRLYAPLVFANARHVAERIRELVAGQVPAIRCLVLDLQAVSEIDVTALDVLRELYDELETGGVDVRFARGNRPLREQVVRWIGNERLGQERFFASASAAVDDFIATHPVVR